MLNTQLASRAIRRTTFVFWIASLMTSGMALANEELRTTLVVVGQTGSVTDTADLSGAARGDQVPLKIVLRDAPLDAKIEPSGSSETTVSEASVSKTQLATPNTAVQATGTPSDQDSTACVGVAFETPRVAVLTDPLSTKEDVSEAAAIDLAYERGRQYLRCGYPICALDTMLCTPSPNEVLKHSKYLAIGEAFGELDLLNEARCYYGAVLRESQDPHLQSAAKQSLCEVERYLASREYLRGSAGATMRYDSDPGVLPTFNAVGIPVAAPATWGNRYTVDLGYDLARSYNSDLTLIYSLYDTENYHAHYVDVTSNDLSLLYRHRGYWLDTPTYAGLRVDYDYMLVGGESFLTAPVLHPYVTFLHNDLASTIFYGEYTSHNYHGQGALDGTPLDTDSQLGRLGVTGRRRFGRDRNMMVTLGYQYQTNNCEGSDYDYTGHCILGSVIWDLPVADMQFSLNAELHLRDYQNPNSILGIRRYDKELAVYGRLLCPLSPRLFLTIDVVADNNESNLYFNKYDRVSLDFGLEYRFPHSWARRSRDIL